MPSSAAERDLAASGSLFLESGRLGPEVLLAAQRLAETARRTDRPLPAAARQPASPSRHDLATNGAELARATAAIAGAGSGSAPRGR
jgi:hypothetical protein